MGKYVEETSKGKLPKDFIGKCLALKKDGAVTCTEPQTFGDNLVIVVDNGHFAAAGYAFDEKELDRFKNGYCGRRYQWYVWDKVKDFAR